MKQDARSLLLANLARVPPDLFAVVDGAFFDDLPGVLKAANLSFIPLYGRKGFESGVSAGPHLLKITDEANLNRLLDCTEDRAACVYWSWPSGVDALHRHLRKINMVEIPVKGTAADDPVYEAVLFRHADPDVLSRTLPVLYVEQYAQFLGDAAGLVMVDPSSEGLRKVPRPKALPTAAPGLIRLDPLQMASLEEGHVGRSRLKVARFLQETNCVDAAEVDDAQLYQTVVAYEASGQRYGLKSERAHMKWAYLMSISAGDIERDDTAKTWFRSHPQRPDHAIDDLFDMLNRLWPR